MSGPPVKRQVAFPIPLHVKWARSWGDLPPQSVVIDLSDSPVKSKGVCSEGDVEHAIQRGESLPAYPLQSTSMNPQVNALSGDADNGVDVYKDMEAGLDLGTGFDTP